jgi:ribosomal protein S18 acetylase RimI-like enzyme
VPPTGRTMPSGPTTTVKSSSPLTRTLQSARQAWFAASRQRATTTRQPAKCRCALPLGRWTVTHERVDLGIIATVSEEPTIRDGRQGDVEAMAWAASQEQRNEWRQQLARGQTGEIDFLVLELGAQIVGKAVIDWTHSLDGVPWLWLGSVDPEYRSRGLGGLGLAEAERRARNRGHTVIEMCVDDDNPRARELYLRSGYSIVGPYLDEHDETSPDGTTVHIVSPGVLLRKPL